MKTKINFNEELRNLEFAKNSYLNELIGLLNYKNEKMIELNKSRALTDIELMIKTLEELKDKIQ